MGLDFGGIIGNVLDSAAGQGIDSIKASEAADLQAARDKRLNDWKMESDKRLLDRQEAADTRREGREDKKTEAQAARDAERNKLTAAEIARKEARDEQRHQETLAKGERGQESPAERTAREYREQAKVLNDMGDRDGAKKAMEMARVTLMQRGSQGVPSMPTLPPKPAGGAQSQPGPIGSAMSAPPTGGQPPTGAFTGNLDDAQSAISAMSDPVEQANAQAALDEQRSRGGKPAPIPQNPAMPAPAPKATPAAAPSLSAGPIGSTLASASVRPPDAGGGVYQKPSPLANSDVDAQRKTDLAYKADLNQRAMQMIATRDVNRLRALIADSREESLLPSTTRKQIYDLLDRVK